MEDRVAILSSLPLGRPSSLGDFLFFCIPPSFPRDFLALWEGGCGNSVKAAARVRHPPLALTLLFPRSLPLSLSRYLGVVLRPPPTPPFSPSVPTVLPWPARAVSRVQRTPRFALRSSRAFLLIPAILTRSYNLVIRLQDRFDCESESNNRYTRNNSMYQLCYRSIRLYRLVECCDLDKLFRERKFRGIAVFLPHGNLDASNICDI